MLQLSFAIFRYCNLCGLVRTRKYPKKDVWPYTDCFFLFLEYEVVELDDHKYVYNEFLFVFFMILMSLVIFIFLSLKYSQFRLSINTSLFHSIKSDFNFDQVNFEHHAKLIFYFSFWMFYDDQSKEFYYKMLGLFYLVLQIKFYYLRLFEILIYLLVKNFCD